MSEELTQIIAECTEAIQSGELTLDECLEKYPAYRAELTDLLWTVAQVRTVPRVYPRAEFRVQARGRLLAQLDAPASNGAADVGMAAQVAGWQAQLLAWWRQLNPQMVAGGAIVIFVGLFAVLLWRGIRAGGNEPGQVVAQVTEEATETPETVEPTEEASPPTATLPPATVVAQVEESVTEEASESETIVAAVEAAQVAASTYVEPQNPLYLPLISDPLVLTAGTAAVEVLQGLVEVQRADGSWTAVNRVVEATQGERIRTMPFSSAKITFHDGSYATLSAESELSLDTVDVKRPEEGFRTLVMTQWQGESDHEVAFRNDGGSRYEVKTPDQGSGIARGTTFKVIFNPGQLARYIVTEGRVDVTGQNRTVTVTAGQVTVLPIGSVPIDPVFTVSGEGEVTAIGATWTVAGQTFLTDEYTIIVGNPQVGDLVRIDGHLLADGSRVADRIVLLRRAVVDQFSLTGEVEEIGTAWVVAGQAIVMGSETVIDDDIAVGDEVQVDGVILADGILQAQVITKIEDAPGLPFAFSGVVQAMGNSWTISGQVITVISETAVDDDIELGDVVSVSGWILEDGTWVAMVIDKQDDDDLATFEFTGLVQDMTPWQVAGVVFETRPWTVIEPQIGIGDRVQVSGIILSDGTKVAQSVTLLDDLQLNVVTFVGVVSGVNPWVVNGITLVTNEETVISGEVVVGISAVVQVQLQPDGSWVVLSIRPLYPEFGLGCLYISSPVTTIVNANTIQVRHWQGNIAINQLGNLAVNHVVSLPLCTGWDGTVIVIGTEIVVIYQPVVVIINNGGGGGGTVVVPPGCKVTKKGKIKCTKKSSKKSSKKS